MGDESFSREELFGAVPLLTTRRSKGLCFTADRSKVLVLKHQFERDIDSNSS